MTSEQFKAARLTLGLSQVALAEELGTTTQRISRWERGVIQPDPIAVWAIERMLKDAL